MYAKVDEALEKRFKMTDFPLNVAVEVTTHCNLKCIMCGHKNLNRPKGTMPIRLYKKIVDEIADKNPGTRLWIDFYGEPLIAGYKLYYMIDYAKKKGIGTVCMNTNGLLLNQEYAEMLLDAGIDYISLDCDGFSKEVYESIRVGGDRDTFYTNTEYLLDLKKKRGSETVIDVKVIEMEENRHEIDQILQYWREKGAWTAVRRLGDWAGFQMNDGKSHTSRIACGHAVATCAITWDGNIASCAWDGDCAISCGNVEQSSIQKIWQKRNEEILRLHFEHRWSELSDACQKCISWRNIGEMRFDADGNPVERSYDTKTKIYTK